MISVSVVCGSRILVWVDQGVAVVTFVFSPFPSHLKNKKGKNQKKKKGRVAPAGVKKKGKRKGVPKRRGDMRKLLKKKKKKKCIERMQ